MAFSSGRVQQVMAAAEAGGAQAIAGETEPLDDAWPDVLGEPAFDEIRRILEREGFGRLQDLKEATRKSINPSIVHAIKGNKDEDGSYYDSIDLTDAQIVQLARAVYRIPGGHDKSMEWPDGDDGDDGEPVRVPEKQWLSNDGQLTDAFHVFDAAAFKERFTTDPDQQAPVVDGAGSADEFRANVRRLLPEDGSDLHVTQLQENYAVQFGDEDLRHACQRFGFVAAGNRGSPRSLLESMDGVEEARLNVWRLITGSAGADETKGE